MKKHLVNMIMAAAITTLLSACGGGGGSSAGTTGGNGGGGTTGTGTAQSVSLDLYNTNLSAYPEASPGVVHRWAYETSLIPVKTNGSAEATQALDLIEATLGKTLFDRTSIAATANASITRGIVINTGITGTTNTGQQCGCVSGNEDPASCYNLGSNTFVNNAFAGTMYIHLGGSSSCAPITSTLAAHEVGHALGLSAHFSEFGDNVMLGSNYWNVLKSLYDAPIGSVPTVVYTNVIQGKAGSGTVAAYAAPVVTPSAGNDFAGQTASIILPNSNQEFTFAATGNVVTSGSLTGTFTKGTNVYTLQFPGETLTINILGTNTTGKGIPVTEVSSLNPGVTSSQYFLTLSSTPTVYTPYTVAQLTNTTLTVQLTANSGISFSFGAASSTGVVIQNVSISFQGGTVLTPVGAPEAGVYTQNSNGSLTMTTSTGYYTLSQPVGMPFQYFTTSSEPLSRISVSVL